MTERIVFDGSAMVDYLVGSPLAGPIGERIENAEVNVPAHFDAEVLSSLTGLQRAAKLTEVEVEQRVSLTAQAPFQRHLLPRLLDGAWARHPNLRLVDALYVELAEQLDAIILTTDSGMASATPRADRIER